MRTAMVRNKVLGVTIEVAHFPQHFTLALLPSHCPLMIGPITFLHLSSSNHTRMVVAKAKIDVRGEKLLVWVKRETFSSLSFSQIFWVPSKIRVTFSSPTLTLNPLHRPNHTLVFYLTPILNALQHIITYPHLWLIIWSILVTEPHIRLTKVR